MGFSNGKVDDTLLCLCTHSCVPCNEVYFLRWLVWVNSKIEFLQQIFLFQKGGFGSETNISWQPPVYILWFIPPFCSFSISCLKIMQPPKANSTFSVAKQFPHPLNDWSFCYVSQVCWVEDPLNKTKSKSRSLALWRSDTWILILRVRTVQVSRLSFVCGTHDKMLLFHLHLPSPLLIQKSLCICREENVLVRFFLISLFPLIYFVLIQSSVHYCQFTVGIFWNPWSK